MRKARLVEVKGEGRVVEGGKTTLEKGRQRKKEREKERERGREKKTISIENYGIRVVCRGVSIGGAH